MLKFAIVVTWSRYRRPWQICIGSGKTQFVVADPHDPRPRRKPSSVRGRTSTVYGGRGLQSGPLEIAVIPTLPCQSAAHLVLASSSIPLEPLFRVWQLASSNSVDSTKYQQVLFLFKKNSGQEILTSWSQLSIWPLSSRRKVQQYSMPFEKRRAVYVQMFNRTSLSIYQASEYFFLP